MRPRRRLTDEERVLRSVPERDWMNQVIETAEWCGWLWYHVQDSRKDNPGFPDLILVGRPGGPNAGRLLAIECKRETGTVSADQLAWLGALEQVRTVEVMAARPRDVDRVMALISGNAVARE
jgi:hypothetical protein